MDTVLNNSTEGALEKSSELFAEKISLPRPAVALLIDGDNISHTYVPSIIERAKSEGELKIVRVYGNENMPRNYKAVILEYDLSFMVCMSPVPDKNTADFDLCMDAMIILREDDIDVFCIASSDSDFRSLVKRLKNSGKKVIVFGEQKGEPLYGPARDEFVVLDGDKVPKPPKAVKKTIKPSKAVASTKIVQKTYRPTSEIEERVKNSLSFVKLDDEGWVDISKIGIYLRNEPEGFDPKLYGYHKLSEILEKFSWLEIKREIPEGGSPNAIAHVYIRAVGFEVVPKTVENDTVSDVFGNEPLPIETEPATDVEEIKVEADGSDESTNEEPDATVEAEQAEEPDRVPEEDNVDGDAAKLSVEEERRIAEEEAARALAAEEAARIIAEEEARKAESEVTDARITAEVAEAVEETPVGKPEETEKTEVAEPVVKMTEYTVTDVKNEIEKFCSERCNADGATLLSAIGIDLHKRFADFNPKKKFGLSGIKVMLESFGYTVNTDPEKPTVQWVKKPAEVKPARKEPVSALAMPSMDTVREEIVKILLNGNGVDGWNLVSFVGLKLNGVIPGFSFKAYGFKKMYQLVESLGFMTKHVENEWYLKNPFEPASNDGAAEEEAKKAAEEAARIAAEEEAKKAAEEAARIAAEEEAKKAAEEAARIAAEEEAKKVAEVKPKTPKKRAAKTTRVGEETVTSDETSVDSEDLNEFVQIGFEVGSDAEVYVEAMTQAPIADTEQEIKDIVSEILSAGVDEDGWMLISEVSAKLRKRVRGFKVKDFGFLKMEGFTARLGFEQTEMVSAKSLREDGNAVFIRIPRK